MASSSKKPVKGEQHRPPDATAPKVNTTWGEQCQLAERLRGMGVTCKACLQGPWYHKPHDGGKNCYKYMLAAGTASSPASVKDMRKEGESTAARVSAPLGETAQTMESRSRPLAQLVRFETKEGTVLLFEPQPLDSWINRECAWDNKKQVYIDLATGDQLTEAEGEDYQRYLQRHKERRHVGGQADELVKLAAKINPRTVVELRFYIAKFPWEVSRLLGESKALYKEMNKQRHGGETAQTAVLQKEEKPDKQKRKKAKEGKTTKEKRNKKAKHNHDTTEGEDLPSASTAMEPAEQRPVGDTENEVDWGGSDGDDKQHNTASPHDAGGSRDDDNPTTSDTTSLRMNWPWGERGRPSDTASADSGIGAQRPRTPSRSPQRRGTDMWRAIQKVQGHMKNARRQ